MTRPLICIDPGHGGRDPGAIAGGHREADIALDHGLALARALERIGYVPLLTRETDRYLDHASRCRAANEAGAKVFVSLHCNASVNPRASGAWVLHQKGDNESAALAARVAGFLDAVIRPAEPGDAVPHPDQSGWTGDRSLYVLRGTRMPALLIELGFITNEGDRARLLDPDQTELTAAAIAAEIARYVTIGATP